LQSTTTDTAAGMAYVYSIAFYEQGAFYHLKEGVPLAGTVNINDFNYYYLDFPPPQVDQEPSSYEITLTAMSGNPDLVVSLDPRNKFPNKVFNNFISEDQLATDSIVIDSQMISNVEDKIGEKLKVSGAYIGVYTNSE
jgi:hypothetical protein